MIIRTDVIGRGQTCLICGQEASLSVYNDLKYCLKCWQDQLEKEVVSVKQQVVNREFCRTKGCKNLSWGDGLCLVCAPYDI